MKANSSRYALVLTLVVFLGTGILVGGCGSDDPVTSAQESGQPLPVRSTPQNSWYHFQWSADQENSDGWIQAIGSSFEYVPDATSLARYPQAFDSWDRETELEFVQALFAANLEFDARMNDVGYQAPNPAGATVSWESYEYSLQVGGAGRVCPVLYCGVANLDFRLEGNFWQLVRWEDVRGGTAPWNSNVILPTLGELRGAFRR